MKFISSSYDPNTGESVVIMQHLGIKFKGKAHLNPEETNPPSEYAGCAYAEIKATIKALKYERKLAKNKADMALDFVKSCECYAKFNKNDETAKSIYRQLNKRIEKVNNLTDNINNLYKKLNILINRREIILKAIDNKKAKQDNL